MGKDSQRQRILMYLLQKKTKITQIDALNEFGCFRLASVIHRLREKYEIKDEWVTQNGKRFKRYYMEG